eukprot:71613-Chlamydomonas_euryale.AAC.1
MRASGAEVGAKDQGYRRSGWSFVPPCAMEAAGAQPCASTLSGFGACGTVHAFFGTEKAGLAASALMSRGGLKAFRGV